MSSVFTETAREKYTSLANGASFLVLASRSSSSFFLSDLTNVATFSDVWTLIDQ